VIRKVAGAFLIAIPFVLIFLAVAADEGVVWALAALGAGIILAGLILAGAILLFGKGRSS